jgi:hypothetical protein
VRAVRGAVRGGGRGAPIVDVGAREGGSCGGGAGRVSGDLLVFLWVLRRGRGGGGA